MKANPALLIATALIFSGSVFGQQVLFVEKQQHRIQLDGSGTTIQAANLPAQGISPFRVEYAVEIPGVTSADFVPPVSSTYPGPTNLLPDGSEFIAKIYFGAKTNVDGINGMDNRFKSGTHTITLDGTTDVFLDLSGDLYPSAPTATLTGSGSWIGGGFYQVGENQAFTVTTSTFANWTDNGALLNHIGLTIWGNSGDVGDAATFSNDTYFGDQDNSSSTFLSFGSGLAAGVYTVEMDYNAVVDIETSIAGYPGATALAMYTMRTQFQIQVIPEPSTYAAIFGGVALVGVMIVRRRRAMVA